MEGQRHEGGGTHGYRPAGPSEGLYPRYEFVPRMAGRLACGELAVEPVLGPVRVAGVRETDNEHSDRAGDAEYVQVSWRDDHGSGVAAGRYPAEQSFPVQIPARVDRLLIRQGIDQAAYDRREVADDIARLIASHLHAGPRSALHRFTVDGSVAEAVYDELELAHQHRQYAREWVDALTRYCLDRKDPAPLPQWNRRQTARAEARAEEWLTAAGISVEALYEQARVKANGNGNGHNNGNERTPHRALLSRKTMKTETAMQLIEAAFTLGTQASRAPAGSTGARFLIRQLGLPEPA